ncbi:unnamed protein product [Echinostoma caproni]|uniref:G_PROTEIN_RECEP_F1_2 domain-containing protein n=1 Tax=Echinostoma caproni TaxID=27848 RepID=A0A183B4B1_9TREM|nr:unnamed protein product [Echinostoma caproni]
MEFSNIPRRYGWYAVLITLFISLFMLLPATALIMWTPIGDKLICWFPEPYQYMEYYHTLISNAAVLQPLAITVINIIIFSIIRRLAKQKQSEAVWTNQAKQSVRACVVLLIVSCVYVVCALPQSVAYICAYTIARTDPSQTRAIRLAYNVADLSWNLYFLRDVVYLIVMFRFMGIFRWCYEVIRGREHRDACLMSDTFLGQDNMTIMH